MAEARYVTVFNLGGSETIHTDMGFGDAHRLWQRYLSANELMPLSDTREPSWPLFVNPHQVKIIQRVTVA